MKTTIQILTCLILIISLITSSFAHSSSQLSRAEAKAFVKKAVIYALETRGPNMDYGKYVSKNFINHVDSNTFNFEQWKQHQKDIKKKVKSMVPHFNDSEMVAEGNQVAAVYYIDLVKNDGSKLRVKDIALFRFQNGKVTYVDELTHLIKGDIKDKDIGSTK